jgi:hypothetical protein
MFMKITNSTGMKTDRTEPVRNHSTIKHETSKLFQTIPNAVGDTLKATKPFQAIETNFSDVTKMILT